MRIYNVYLNKIKTSLAKILKALRSYEVGKHNNIFLFKCENIFVYLISVCRVGSAGWLQVHSTVPPGHYRCTVLYHLDTTGARYCTAWSLRPGPGWLVSVCVYVLDVPGPWILNLISCIRTGYVNRRVQTDSYIKFVC